MKKISKELQALINKHREVYSGLGEPIKVMERDGYPCVIYYDGKRFEWFHYNIKKGTWF